MTKKMQEMLSKIDEKRLQAKAFLEGENKDVEKAQEILKEIEELKKEFEVSKQIYDMEQVEAQKAQTTTGLAANVEDTQNVAKETAVAIGLKGVVANKAITFNNGSDGTKGGYTIPADALTDINKYKEAKFSFGNEITEEKTETRTGSRVYKKQGVKQKFVNLDEGAAITTQLQGLEFETKTYTIEDKGAFIPVTNTLLEDSDQAIYNELVTLIGDADVDTANEEILTAIRANKVVAIDGFDALRTGIIKSLSLFAAGLKIYTNDDGIAYLDGLKDGNNRPLLNQDVTTPNRWFIRCGVMTVEVVPVPSEILETKDAKIPFIAGSLKEFYKRMLRQGYAITASTTASIGSLNAFAQNLTLLRVIMRDDYMTLDNRACILFELPTTASINDVAGMPVADVPTGLNAMTVEQLKELATSKGLEVKSGMLKQDIIDLINSVE